MKRHSAYPFITYYIISCSIEPSPLAVQSVSWKYWILKTPWSYSHLRNVNVKVTIDLHPVVAPFLGETRRLLKVGWFLYLKPFRKFNPFVIKLEILITSRMLSYLYSIVEGNKCSLRKEEWKFYIVGDKFKEILRWVTSSRKDWRSCLKVFDEELYGKCKSEIKTFRRNCFAKSPSPASGIPLSLAFKTHF